MNFRFSNRSLLNLKGVHPHLQAVVARALQLTEVDFIVIDGTRTLDEQAQLVARGKSKTMNSRHLSGHAVDVAAFVAGDVSWRQSDYVKISHAFKKAAAEYGIPLRWGGDWDRDGDHRDEVFFDGPHFELERKDYPAGEDWPAPAEADEWPEDLRGLLRFGDPSCPVAFPADPAEAVAAPAARRRRRPR